MLIRFVEYFCWLGDFLFGLVYCSILGVMYGGLLYMVVVCFCIFLYLNMVDMLKLVILRLFVFDKRMFLGLRFWWVIFLECMKLILVISCKKYRCVMFF